MSALEFSEESESKKTMEEFEDPLYNSRDRSEVENNGEDDEVDNLRRYGSSEELGRSKDSIYGSHSKQPKISKESKAASSPQKDRNEQTHIAAVSKVELASVRVHHLARKHKSCRESPAPGSGNSPAPMLLSLPEERAEEVAAQLSSAQVRVLRAELQNAIQDGEEREQKLKSLETKLRETEQERNKLLRENSSKQQQVEKLQRASNEIASRANKLKNLDAASRKELAALRQKLKQVADGKAAAESKLAHVMEENARYKADLDEARQAARESGESDKRRIEDLSAENKRLEKQRTELLVALKKQAKLVDNLKRQKMHLEAAKALELTEQEFSRVLDWGS